MATLLNTKTNIDAEKVINNKLDQLKRIIVVEYNNVDEKTKAKLDNLLKDIELF